MKKAPELGKRMGITQQIKIYEVDRGSHAAIRGTNLSFGPLPLLIGPGFEDLSLEEMEFLLVHEFEHIANNDSFYNACMSLALLITDFAFAILCTPFVIPAVEFVASFVENAKNRSDEKRADQSAINLIGSNEGAVRLFSRYIHENKQYRIQKKQESYGFRCLNLLDSDGNDLKDIKHPQLTERLKYSKECAFQKV